MTSQKPLDENLQRHLYSIDIYDEDTVLTDHTSSAGQKRYVVTKEELMKFFHAKVRLVPEEGLLWMESDGQVSTYLFDLRPQKQPRTIFMRDRDKEARPYKVSVPGLLVKAEIVETGRAKTVKSISLACYAGRKWTKGKPLYELALPNINGSSLCLGSGCNNLIGVTVRQAIEHAIFETPYNTHNNICGKDHLPFRKYHKLHQGRFPFKTLNPVRWRIEQGI